MKPEYRTLWSTFLVVSIVFNCETEARKVCPDGCVCQATESSIRVDCTGEDVTQIPEGIPVNVTELRITKANISTLGRGAFSGFVRLTSLTVSGSLVRTVEPGALDGLVALTRLDLSENELADCDGIFTGADKLTVLYLYGNRLTQITSACFQNVTSLEKLFLSNNTISSIEGAAFANLSRMNTLNLNWNNLTSINHSHFTGLANLKYVMLTHNSISNVGVDTFVESPNIAYLWLSYNNISELPVNLCSGFKELYFLSLSSNQLSEIPSAVWRNRTHLQSLVLKDNPFSRIRADAFSGLTSLMYLVIDACPYLSVMEEHAFRGLENLVTLSIEHNKRLKRIEARTFSSRSLVNVTNLYLRDNAIDFLDEQLFQQFPKLHTARVEMNPFNCTCRLRWMREAMDNESLYWAREWTRDPHKPTCSTPSNLDRYAISALYSDDLTCDPPRLESANENPWVERNGMAVFQVSLSRGIPATKWWCSPLKRWIYPTNDSSIAEDNIFAMETKYASSRVLASLTILNVTENQLGNYTMAATNAGGVSYVQFMLSFAPAPRPTVNPNPAATSGTQASVIIFGVVGALLAAAIIVVGYLVLRKKTTRHYARVPLITEELDDGFVRDRPIGASARSYGAIGE